VRVVDDDDPPTAGGASGAPVPGPVPGCETLSLVGDPVLIPGTDYFASYAQLAMLDGNRAGLSFMSHLISQSTDVLSLVIDDPFGAWPPVLNDSVLHFEGEIYNAPGAMNAQPGGTYAVGFGVRRILAFDQPGVVRDFDQGWSQVFPYPDGGFDILKYSDALGYELQHLASAASASPVASLPSPGCLTVRSVLGARRWARRPRQPEGLGRWGANSFANHQQCVR
jgi:hypothetical protein